MIRQCKSRFECWDGVGVDARKGRLAVQSHKRIVPRVPYDQTFSPPVTDMAWWGPRRFLLSVGYRAVRFRGTRSAIRDRSLMGGLLPFFSLMAIYSFGISGDPRPSCQWESRCMYSELIYLIWCQRLGLRIRASAFSLYPLHSLNTGIFSLPNDFRILLC